MEQMTSEMNTDLLIKKYQDKKATISVVGLGYVGIPLVLALHEKGFNCIGYDIDKNKINSLREGRSYIKTFTDEQFQSLKSSDRFTCDDNPAILSKADAILICVPTPLNKHREPDMSYVEGTIDLVAKNLGDDQLIILESTTYPGTTQEIIQTRLEKEGRVLGKDVFIAYSPEREDPGNHQFSTKRIPKVVGADDPASLEMALALYANIVPDVIKVSDSKTAEAVKLTENIFRSVNIALVNELKVVYSKMGIDVWEVIDAAKSKPFGFMPFYPGPGLGGHCIPIDPFYLTWKAREFDITPRFIELSGQINGIMPDYVIHNCQAALSDMFEKAIKGSKLLILGVAYKKNVDDVRESPAMVIMEKLMVMGAKVDFHDPYVDHLPPMREHPTLEGKSSVSIDDKALLSYDACLILTDHDNVDYSWVVEHSNLIIDSRNAAKGLDSTKIIKS